MKKKILKFSVIFVFAALLVCALAMTTNAASGTCDHVPGAAATCTTPCVCLRCGEELYPVRGHSSAAPATCGDPETCIMCGTEMKPAKGYEYCVLNASEPTCTVPSYCLVCGHVAAQATGHTVVDTADCGHAVKCLSCCEIMEDRTGEHTFDWTTAVTVRAASADVPGIVNVTCTTCERTFERSYTNAIADTEGSGSVVSTVEMAGATLKVDTLAVADSASTQLAKDYSMLQTFKLTLQRDGTVVTPSGARVVTMALNNGAKQVEQIKVFAMKADGTYEEMKVVSVEGGKVQFETSYFSGAQFAIVDAKAAPNNNSNANTNNGADNGGNIGLIIGIVAGGVVVVAAAVAVVVVLRKKKANSAE